MELAGTDCPVDDVVMDTPEASGDIESIGIVATSAGSDK